MSGTSAHGQGHATIVLDDRRRPARHPAREDHATVQSDTALVRTGGGTGGSRSLQLGGNAVSKAADELRDEGPRARRRDARGRTRRHRARRRRRVRRRRRARRSAAGPSSRRTRTSTRAASASTPTSRSRAPPSRSAPTSRSSRSTPRPAGSRRCATSPSTTAVGSSTR